MLDIIKQIIGLYVLVPVVFIVGCFLTVQLRGLQFTHLWRAICLIFEKKSDSLEFNKAFSSFTAVAAVLGGNLGTGNIAGIAVALTTGGPGALFWMWVMAFLGAIIKFTGCFLGVKYREKFAQGFTGGPMYYLSKGLGNTVLAKIFCLFTVLSAFTVGNMVQVNSIALPLTTAGISPLYIGIVMACFVAIVLWGGANYFAQVANKIVPFMALLYIFACLYILGIYSDHVFPALQLIFHSAFNSSSLLGGVLGFSILDAIRVGFDRGLFATDAGVGLAPILHAQVSCPGNKLQAAFTQGMISIVAPIIVMIICMITGTVLLVTGAWHVSGLESTNVCIRAFESGFGSEYAGYIVSVTLCLFAFTTILTWAYCAESAVLFLSKSWAVKLFRIFFVLLIPVGAFCSVRFVWSFSDISLNAMLLLNLIGVVGLAKEVVSDVRSLKNSSSMLDYSHK